tara:strand:+ start:458 stop:1222 length:765 start_codon:yes stop_codon:yes gene_type:complete
MKKNIYIIGGNGLIGSAFLNLYSKNDANFFVLDLTKVKNNTKNFITNIYFDCSKMEKIEKKLKDIFIKYGEPDILINCSYPVTKDWNKNTFEKIKYSSFKKNIEIHLNSYCWIAKIFADRMVLKNKYGNIVLLSSIYGIVAQNEENYKGTSMSLNMTYPIIKSGIIGFVKQSASYYGKSKIRINALCPGAILGHIKGSQKTQNIKFIKKFSASVPLKRLAEAKEIACVLKFLISDNSSYISGQAIIADGGYTVV